VKMQDFGFETIYIEKKCRDYPLTRNILDNTRCKNVEYIDSPSRMKKRDKGSVASGKRDLLLAEQKGNFIKPCPGTKQYLCCNYYFLNFSTNCPLDCTYCILQHYINNPYITVYVNLDKLRADLDTLSKSRKELFRVGSGELTDSLVLDGITLYAQNILPLFKKYDNVLLELKTKTDQVSKLPVLERNQKVVTSWSLNPDTIIEKEELKTASLKERLNAAYECQKKGYRIGFHFDPLIHHLSWEKNYKKVVDRIFEKIDPANILWISLGGLRFHPSLKNIVQQRFPHTEIFLGELVPCPDGKMRYVKPVRAEIYKKMAEWIRGYSPDPFIYFCMESREIYKEVLGFEPRNNKELDRLFAKRVNQVYEGSLSR